MRLRVQYTAQLRAAAGRDEEEVDLPDGSSLGALLGHLAERLGQAAEAHGVTSSGDAHRSLLIVINDAVVAPRQTSLIVLRTGDVVTFLPPVAGG